MERQIIDLMKAKRINNIIIIIIIIIIINNNFIETITQLSTILENSRVAITLYRGELMEKWKY